MTSHHISRRMAAVLDEASPIFYFATRSTYARRVGEPGIYDFAFGNPHEMPLAGFVAALGNWHVPQNKD
ncbi:MAG: hypothetical protein L0332_00650 [Chloroflexi bacterium]|nr:hypothetical protein [Chloroflexota bacterium]MCI0577595.1 hypothetical protein [Chloroflexota bacterium]MCI0644185.1 hypothetical protein [Chloroflexota bacterium]MCI0725232.1 hypothetical protein [Chloroflexota bacterium]